MKINSKRICLCICHIKVSDYKISIHKFIAFRQRYKKTVLLLTSFVYTCKNENNDFLYVSNKKRQCMSGVWNMRI